MSGFDGHTIVPLAVRFWSKVDKSGDCWMWTAAVSSTGYGQIGLGRRVFYAHRISFEMHHGPIPQGKEVCHTCDVRACVRPDHLFAGTRSDNMRDCSAKGRSRNGDVRGEDSGRAKLTNAAVVEIDRRLREGESPDTLAHSFGVKKTTIKAIANGQNWNFLTGRRSA